MGQYPSSFLYSQVEREAGSGCVDGLQVSHGWDQGASGERARIRASQVDFEGMKRRIDR